MLELRTKFTDQTIEYKILSIAMTTTAESSPPKVIKVLKGAKLNEEGRRILHDIYGDAALEVIKTINEGVF